MVLEFVFSSVVLAIQIMKAISENEDEGIQKIASVGALVVIGITFVAYNMVRGHIADATDPMVYTWKKIKQDNKTQIEIGKLSLQARAKLL